jgi:imidazolonepropionase
VSVTATFLGAHALPPEYAEAPDDYIDHVCYQMIPAVAAEGLADAVDAFCEGIGFSPAQTRRVFQAAREHGLPVKLHAEQLSNLNGAAWPPSSGRCRPITWSTWTPLASPPWLGPEPRRCCCPGAYYFVRETKLPPIQACVRPAYRWPWPPTATPAPRP